MFAVGSIIWAAHRITVFSSIYFCFSYAYVRQTKLASSLVKVWAHYKIAIGCLIDWLIDQFLKVFFVDSDAPEVVAAGTHGRLPVLVFVLAAVAAAAAVDPRL